MPYITNPGRCGVSGDNSRGKTGRGVGECREAQGFNCRSSARSKNCAGADKDRGTQAPKETPMQAKEGVPVPETVQFVVQGSTNFIIMPVMMFLDEETT
jgi:hypothetical protein